MIPIQYVRFDDGEPIASVRLSRYRPFKDEAVTLEPLGTGNKPRRYRVADVDHGYVQSTPKSSDYRESTLTVYLIDADDPRRHQL